MAGVAFVVVVAAEPVLTWGDFTTWPRDSLGSTGAWSLGAFAGACTEEKAFASSASGSSSMLADADMVERAFAPLALAEGGCGALLCELLTGLCGKAKRREAKRGLRVRLCEVCATRIGRSGKKTPHPTRSCRPHPCWTACSPRGSRGLWPQLLVPLLLQSLLQDSDDISSTVGLGGGRGGGGG